MASWVCKHEMTESKSWGFQPPPRSAVDGKQQESVGFCLTTVNLKVVFFFGGGGASTHAAGVL